MWQHIHHRLVVGFHGCDRAVAEQVLLGRNHLKPSTNTFDWLGKGIYFWEHSGRRALQFAREQEARGKVNDPCVLGAYIHLGKCFDLTDTDTTGQLRQFYDDYVATRVEFGLPLHHNKPASPDAHDLLLRDLDCAVLNLGLTNLDTVETDGACFYQTVRGVFVEGETAYPGAAIHSKTHIQIAVRDRSCILGYFMPTGYDDGEDTE